jgi:acyl-CoA synthetase (AMP-forming)/AMP-acid ligase II
MDLAMDTERVPFRAFPAEAIEGSLAARFESCAERHADRLAIHDDAGDWTYAEVNSAANSIAHQLIAVMERDRPVVVLFEDNAWYLVAILAVLRPAGSMSLSIHLSR